MANRPTIEQLIYGLVIALSVIVLVLAVLSSSFLVDTRVVYQGY